MTEAQKQARIEVLETELAHRRFQIAILERLQEVLEEMPQRGTGWMAPGSDRIHRHRWAPTSNRSVYPLLLVRTAERGGD